VQLHQFLLVLLLHAFQLRQQTLYVLVLVL
jgi:hypothetical protein